MGKSEICGKNGVDYVKIHPIFICDYVKNSSVFICDYVKFVISTNCVIGNIMLFYSNLIYCAICATHSSMAVLLLFMRNSIMRGSQAVCLQNSTL